MRIAETFVSIQGEGTLAGTPSFFIRTTGCNLRCSWCDTPYTSWAPEGTRRSVDELVAEAAAAGVHDVVVTGGEPLLQRRFPSLAAALSRAGHRVTVETAGTVAPEFVCNLLSVSPKTSSSDPEGRWRERHIRLRTRREPLRRLLATHPDYQLKLVIRDARDMDEVLELVEELDADPARVLLMPEGATAAAVAARAPLVAELCVTHRFRYSPRLHLDLFGGGRGV